MQRSGTIGFLVAGLLASGTASADWSGKGTFGGVLARGNTETETINLNLDELRISSPIPVRAKSFHANFPNGLFNAHPSW